MTWCFTDFGRRIPFSWPLPWSQRSASIISDWNWSSVRWSWWFLNNRGIRAIRNLLRDHDEDVVKTLACVPGSSYFRPDTDDLYINLNAKYPGWHTATSKQSLAGWLSQAVWGFQTAVLVYKYFICLNNFHDQERFLDIQVLCLYSLWWPSIKISTTSFLIT